MNETQFDELVHEAIENIPHPYNEKLQLVAFLIEDVPNEEQRISLKLRPCDALYGLYEGVPLPRRQGRTDYLPDKITIFRQPMLSLHTSNDELRKQIFNTVWHEVAHFYGLDHDKIYSLQRENTAS